MNDYDFIRFNEDQSIWYNDDLGKLLSDYLNSDDFENYIKAKI